LPPIRSRRRVRPSSVVALRLQDQRRLQCVAEPLVLDDRSAINVTEPVVALMAKDLAVGSDLDVAVGVLVDVDVAVDQLAVRLAILEQVDDLVVLQGERAGDLALHAPAEDQVQVLVGADRPVRVMIALRRLANRALKSAMNCGANSLAASRVLILPSLSSFTSRSCSVRLARSTRPFAWLELAHRMSTLSSNMARPNWVTVRPKSVDGASP